MSRMFVRMIGFGALGTAYGAVSGAVAGLMVGLATGAVRDTVPFGVLYGAVINGIVFGVGSLLAGNGEATDASIMGRITAMKKQVVLFLCPANAARSQMAEAFLKRDAADRFEVYSAGLEPKEINPFTIRVMSEVGIDLSGQRAKGVREFLGRLAVQVAIIVCERVEANCPSAWPGAMSLLEWPFPDPAACAGGDKERLEKFRSVRDQIEGKVKAWLAQNDPADPRSVLA